MALTLPIAVSIDRHYLTPLRTMLRSLVARVRPGVTPVLYLVHSSLNHEEISSVSSIVKTEPVVPPPELVNELPTHPSFPKEAAFPLFLADLLAGVTEQVLFLDADLLVLDDVYALWESGTRGKPVAAVADAAVPTCGSPRGVKHLDELGIPQEAPYFNAGVMLLQLNQWRQRGVTQKALQYLRKAGSGADFLHQEALNATLWSEWTPLDHRWNVLAGPAGRPHPKPAVIHFAGRMKPWRMPTRSPFYGDYVRQLGSSATAPSWRERLMSGYDRHLRRWLYPVERKLWERRWI